MIRSDVDLLPEDVKWQDEGCELCSSCLNCPLPRCVEEEPRGKQKLRMSARTRQMKELRQDGNSIEKIAHYYNVSKRTVQRALKIKNDAEGISDG